MSSWTNSTKELSKRGMNFEPLSLVDSFPPALFDRLLGEIRAFSQHENESLTDAWLRMKEMLKNCHGHNLSKGNIIKIFYHGLNEITQEVLNVAASEEAKFMQTFRRTRFYNDYHDRDSNRDNWRSSGRNNYNRYNYQSHSDDKPNLQKQLSDFIKAQQSTNSFVKDTFMDLKNKLETTTKNQQASIQNLEAKFDRLADKQSGRPSGSLPSLNLTQKSSKSYDPPDNPNDQQNDSETPINFDSDGEDDEPTPQTKPKRPKLVKETPKPRPYKPKISYP
ncbi:hypothetical protein Tco_1394682 [Tanacetum coccineum]